MVHGAVQMRAIKSVPSVRSCSTESGISCSVCAGPTVDIEAHAYSLVRRGIHVGKTAQYGRTMYYYPRWFWFHFPPT